MTESFTEAKLKSILVLLAVLFTVACSTNQNLRTSAVPATRTLSESTQTQTENKTPRPTTVNEKIISPPPPTAESTVTPIPTRLPPPEFSNPILDSFQQTAAQWGAELMVVDMSNTGLWQYTDGALVHPIALEVVGGHAYLVESGRVMEIDLHGPGEPNILLAPADEVEGVPVLELLDLAVSGARLLVLDRAGDVYAYEFDSKTWQLDRYDRPVEASSGHYFVAVSAGQSKESTEPTRALLETNYKFAQLYDEEQTRIWRLPEERAVDLDYTAGDVFILQRELHEQNGHITKYRDTSSVPSFAPRLPITQPRQLFARPEAVYILDQAGQRMIVLDPQYGQLLRIIQLPQDRPISAAALDSDTGNLLLAAQDRLYFVGDPARRQTIPAPSSSADILSHNTVVLSTLNDFVVPIGGSNITFRDFQLPGAPRHYRLGIHNGIDLYWQPGTDVHAAGDGLVIRADHDYQDPTAQELREWSEDTQQLGFTSQETLDNYMGRQVWIEHEPGIVTRYAHLRSIEPGVTEGVSVSRGQVIGEVGNSGSPASLEGEAADAHLHYELWINDSYLGQFLRPIEARDWIEQIFPLSR